MSDEPHDLDSIERLAPTWRWPIYICDEIARRTWIVAH
jgi:hypothetical protein